jgi:hypothetical protein
MTDFWAMVYELGSEVIVQITSEYESGKVGRMFVLFSLKLVKNSLKYQEIKKHKVLCCVIFG